ASSYLNLMDTARKYLPDIALAGDIIVGFCGETDNDFQETVELVKRVQYQSLYIFRYSPRPGTAADRGQADDIPDEVKAARNSELLAVQQGIQEQIRKQQIGKTVEVLVEGFSKAARKARGETKGQVRTRGKSSPTFRVREANGAPIAGVANGSPRLLPSRDEVPQCAQGRDAISAADFDLPEQASEQDRGAEVSRDKSDQLVGRTPHDAVVLFDAPESYIGAIVEVHVESATAHSLFGRLIGVKSPPRVAEKISVDSAQKPAGQFALPIVT
ncbi:MAG: TRAM domain-containing protein, partial [Phycisphaerae bacterium]